MTARFSLTLAAARGIVPTMNNKYIIKVASPLLRHGLTIETEASELYAVDVANTLMDIVRRINHPEPDLKSGVKIDFAFAPSPAQVDARRTDRRKRARQVMEATARREE